MKKIIAFIGSDRRKGTYESVRRFEQALNALEEVDFEYIQLKDVNLEFCQGCKRCFDEGEEFCPLDDDRNKIMEKIETADGIILASPNYAFHISARTKNLIDRLAFTFHRPRYFGKVCMPLVVQGVHGGKKVSEYLASTARHMGFSTSAGCVINTLEPMTEKRYKAMDEAVSVCAREFHAQISKTSLPVPTLKQLMLFRMTRTGIRESPVKLYDHDYFKQQGWFESDYYYDVRLSPFKKIIGSLSDRAGRMFVKAMD